jgi:hypothetical protein
MTTGPQAHSMDFATFYRNVFIAEHRHPANIAAHVLGVAAGLGLLISALLGAVAPWAALAFPVVHAVPGLLGHRLFERNAAVGDVRVARRDHPLWWFIVANHWLMLRLLLGRRP